MLRGSQWLMLGIVLAIAPRFSSANPATALKQRSPHLYQELQKLGASGKRIVFIDIDNTLALQNERTKEWIVYNGARTFLQELRKDFIPVLLTANTWKNIDHLLAEHPWLRQDSALVIASEDYCPTFSLIIEDVKKGSNLAFNDLSPDEWKRHLFAAWKKDPQRYLPPGVSLDFEPLDNEDWRNRVYLPYIFPDKSELVYHFDALLVDDRFGVKTDKDSYAELIQNGRGLFSGPVGDATADSGPDYARILQKVRQSDQRLTQLKHELQCSYGLR